MSQLTKTIEKYGAGLVLTISGPPKKVAAAVNGLYNFGVITNIPDDYKEDNHTVSLLSDPKRFQKGIRAQAYIGTRRLIRQRGLRATLRNFRRILRLRIERFENSFLPTESVYSRAQPHEYSQGLIHDLGWNNETVS